MFKQLIVLNLRLKNTNIFGKNKWKSGVLKKFRSPKVQEKLQLTGRPPVKTFKYLLKIACVELLCRRPIFVHCVIFAGFAGFEIWFSPSINEHRLYQNRTVFELKEGQIFEWQVNNKPASYLAFGFRNTVKWMDYAYKLFQICCSETHKR